MVRREGHKLSGIRDSDPELLMVGDKMYYKKFNRGFG